MAQLHDRYMMMIYQKISESFSIRVHISTSADEVDYEKAVKLLFAVELAVAFMTYETVEALRFSSLPGCYT